MPLGKMEAALQKLFRQLLLNFLVGNDFAYLDVSSALLDGRQKPNTIFDILPSRCVRKVPSLQRKQSFLFLCPNVQAQATEAFAEVAWNASFFFLISVPR